MKKLFELPEATQIAVTNVNARPELHGKDRVQAVDIACLLTGPNTLLDLINPDLREHYYHNAARKAGQRALVKDEPLPNLRFPQLPNEGVKWDKGAKSRGYRFQQDYGIEEARLDFSDAVLTGLEFDCLEGGTVNIRFTVQYNGEELDDAMVLSETIRLAVERDVHIKLLAPPEMLKVSKGYRAGHKDTPLLAGDGNPDQGQLGADPQDEDGDERDPATQAFLDTGTPAVKH